MKIGTQRPPAQDPSPSTQQPPPPRNHTADAAELHAQREPVPPPPRVSLDPARPRDATAQPSPSREPSPQAPPEPSSPVPPAHLDTAAQSDDVDPRDYAADSPTAILRHINAAYPPIIHYTLHIGMLVKDLHERIGECHAWCEAAVGAGMGEEPAVRETMDALERLRFVVPRGVGRTWIGRG